MIILCTRNEIITTKKIIGSELAKMQQAFYDEEDLQFCKNSNEENLYLEQFDCLENEIINYATFNKIIGSGHSDIDTFAGKLAEKLTALFRAVNATRFIIITHLKLDFFSNSNNRFKPLKNAYKKLEKIIRGNTYKEAFVIDMNSLPGFIEMLFWITRCGADAPEYIFLFDEKEQIQVSLCKYGNIHLTEYHKEQLTQSKLKELGWTIIEGRELDNFSEDGKITGRQIKV